MTEPRLCIVVPVYKAIPRKEEVFSLEQLFRFANGEDIFCVAPDRLDLSAYEAYIWTVQRFSQKYFKNVDGYTKLLLRTEFYERFVDYDYMLICQTDALLLQSTTKIYDLMKLPYDYYGAPWPNGVLAYKYSFRGMSLVKRYFEPRICYVGNGGFSLRNISRTIALLQEKRRYTRIWNSGEDQFFAYHGQCNKSGYRIAPRGLSEKFALEQDAREKMQNNVRPIGIHAWEKYYSELLEKGEGKCYRD